LNLWREWVFLGIGFQVDIAALTLALSLRERGLTEAFVQATST
jgi:hypothetical protein